MKSPSSLNVLPTTALAATLLIANESHAQITFAVGAVTSNVTYSPASSGLFTNGVFYQHPFGTMNAFPPTPAIIGVDPELANDSYIAIANEAVNSDTMDYPELQELFPGVRFLESSLEGGWAYNSVDSTEPFNGRTLSNAGGRPFDIFLGRYTTVGGTLQGELGFAAVVVGDPAGFSRELDDFLLEIGGPTVFPDAGIGEFDDVGFRLRVDSFDSPQGLVNDLYIEAIPTPGTAAILALASAAALRRRRR